MSALRSSLWFVPTLMVLTAIVLALILIEVDGRARHDWLAEYPRLFGAGADGSRGMLSAIASSMITVAGLSFSLTIVAMAQASSQYTSRILRNFMRDRANQFVLGFFVGVFAYCLIVLRTIRGGDEGRFIPAFAALCGLALAIASIGVLIFFIHHIASLIQASSIISSVAFETIAVVERLFPEQMGEEAGEREEERMAAEIDPENWRVIAARETGYVRDVDADGLVEFAAGRGGVVKMECGIGEFIVKNSPLAAFNGEGAFDDAARTEFENLYVIDKYRTIDKDAAFGIRQLVDIALKALSPGVNDTTTAIVCVDYLGAILAEFAGRRVESRFRSEAGKVRVIARGATFASLTDEAFDQIRDVADGNTAIYLRQLDSIQTIARQTKSEKRRGILAKHIALVADEAERTLKSEYNQQKVSEKIAETKVSLKAEFS
ncbi:MAG: DUF2254 domain-containing protein [Acidobacteriota bacterium]|nr:DUF2254 domain-containing protein [Acidobacteriota bacterium]